MRQPEYFDPIEMIEWLGTISLKERIEIKSKLVKDTEEANKLYLENGASPDDIERLEWIVDSIPEIDPNDPSVMICDVLDEAEKLNQEVESEQVDLSATDLLTWKFPSGCDAIDFAAGGGAYGVFSLGGEPGIGKSWMAISAAVKATKEEWQVYYVNTELELREISNRLIIVNGGQGPKLWGMIRILMTPGRLTLLDIKDKIKESVILGSTHKILVIFDSVNRMAKLMERTTRGGYLSALSDWGEFARAAAQMSEGRIAFMLISELNQRGNDKGEQLGYLSSLHLRLIKDKDNSELIEAEIMKNRRFQKGGIPALRLDRRSSTFVVAEGFNGKDER